MPLYKVCNASRTLKKCLVADSMYSLLKKAAEKLCLNGQLQVVIDQDGAEVDEDEVLLELQQQTLMVLEGSQEWCCEVKIEAGSAAPPPPPPAEISPPPPPPAEIYFSIKEDSEDPTFMPKNQVSEESRPERLHPLISELPQFSGLVLRHLKDGTIELVYNKFIEEAANFYYYYDVSDSAQYRAIGQQMYAAYPSIKMESGNYPWSFFTKTLSQKLRHIRHGLKRKSHCRQTSSQGCLKKRKTFSVVHANQNTTTDSGDQEAHIKELQDEWKKASKSRNKGHIKVLLDETRTHRVRELKSNSRILKEAVDLAPCFQDGYFLIHELRRAYGKEELYSMVQSLEAAIRACFKLMGKSLKDDAFDEDADVFPLVVEAIRYVENQTKFNRGNKAGNPHFKSAVEILTDVGEEDVATKLKTTENQSPKLVVFTSDGRREGAFVVGDRTVIKCHKDCLMTDILQLVGTYYVFDLDYPKCYAIFLGFVQQFVFGELFVRESSKNFKFFVKKFRPVYENMKEQTD